MARKKDWSKGSTNQFESSRVPDGFARSIVNLDPLPGGTLELRTGYEQLVSGTAIRALFSLGTRLVYVDGDQLRTFDTRTNTSTTLSTVAGAGAVAGAVLNDQLYISTPSDSLRFDGALKPWGVPAPAVRVEVTSGPLPAGIYKIGATALGADDVESGCLPYILRVPEGSALRVTSADPRRVRVYCTVVDGATLFYQGDLFAGALRVGIVDDGKETLETGGTQVFPAVEHLVAHHSLLVGSYGRHLYISEAMYPHLWNPKRGFVQLPAAINMLAATEGGVYVGADKTYFVQNLDSDEPSMRAVLDHPAADGTGVTLPDGRVTWFSQYGQVIGDAAGNVERPNFGIYAPETAGLGAAGVLDHNGVQSIVTTMRGPDQENRLASGDYYRAEIIDER